ncbi:hypothetical protein A7K69_10180 [Parageobacillus thermoglucosidasius]|uniref:Uncharacterized protein n=1 Tax=Parageobacillus thermoglucosidasius TaxID=1426 RepID=A0A1B7KRA2_PARTM|nr:hypothetical protein A7K69_10180 [Parageobacillus thermoglucosidasius]
MSKIINLFNAISWKINQKKQGEPSFPVKPTIDIIIEKRVPGYVDKFLEYLHLTLQGIMIQ